MFEVDIRAMSSVTQALMASEQYEFQLYKVQLDEMLMEKYVDQSLLLGFNSVVLSKFQTAIMNNFQSYLVLVVSEGRSADELEFTTRDYFVRLWTDFHYPIIKFFQHQHSILYNSIVQLFEQSRKDPQIKFKVKPVEMRKLNDNFKKFMKQIYQFYFQFLRHWTILYKHRLVQAKLLRQFDFTMLESAITIKDRTLEAHIAILMHRCLLTLGDISRHRAFVDLNYTNPSMTNRDFFKYKELPSQKKLKLMKPSYEPALQFYDMSILLLPAINEPYNHKAVICNAMDCKFQACYWFLRSQFTRAMDYTLGRNNLNSILKKKWFVSRLYGIFEEDGSSSDTIDDLNVILICLVGYFYMPKVYKHGPNIVKNLKFSKVEVEFFKSIQSNFSKLIADRDFFLDQFSCLIMFERLMKTDCNGTEDGSDQEHFDGGDREKIVKFILRYTECILDLFGKEQVTVDMKANPLMTVRLVLSWLKVNRYLEEFIQQRPKALDSVVTTLNRMIGSYKDITLNVDETPKRDYFFYEDVKFREFKIINDRFRDFDDNHLFLLDSQDCLAGEKVANTDETYENRLRVQAIISLSKKVLEPFNVVFAQSKFSVVKKAKPVKAERKKAPAPIARTKEFTAIKEKVPKKKVTRSDTPVSIPDTGDLVPMSTEPSVASVLMPSTSSSFTNANEVATARVPSSLAEIESMILSHASHAQTIMNLQKETAGPYNQTEVDLLRDSGLTSMVDALVDDGPAAYVPPTTRSSIWSTSVYGAPAMQTPMTFVSNHNQNDNPQQLLLQEQQQQIQQQQQQLQLQLQQLQQQQQLHQQLQHQQHQLQNQNQVQPQVQSYSNNPIQLHPDAHMYAPYAGVNSQYYTASQPYATTAHTGLTPVMNQHQPLGHTPIPTETDPSQARTSF